MLASVPDPRGLQGRQYSLEFILTICVVAVLAGAKNYREIGSHAADMPQELMKKLGVNGKSGSSSAMAIRESRH